jgi:hypothetical protein
VSNVGTVYTASDLHNLLSNPATIAWLIAGERDFYIFCTDGTNLTVQPNALAVAMAREPNGTPWLAPMIGKDPDGSQKLVINDASQIGPAFFDPTVTPDPFCSELFSFGWTEWNKNVSWTPGSGYNGNLGNIEVKRWTDVYSLGVCNPL